MEDFQQKIFDCSAEIDAKQMNYKQTIEKMAEQEHIQWEHWSKEIGESIVNTLNHLESGRIVEAKRILQDRLYRWRKNWKPYKKLTNDMKDEDREWAEKAYDLVSIKCPVWQCGGIMTAKERKPPEKGIEEYDGDYQTPDMVCTNCKAIYQFKGFKQNRKRLIPKGVAGKLMKVTK